MKQRYRARFRLWIVFQSLVLTATCLGLVWSVWLTDHFAVPVLLGLLLVLQVFLLIKHVEAHVDTLEDFFATINYEDFTRRYIANDVDAELKTAFNRILDRFQIARAERDLQASYLETVVRHVPVPFLATRPNGQVTLANNPARRLTGIPAIKTLKDLSVLDQSLPTLMQDIEAGEQRLLQTKLRGMPVELRISVSEIRMDGEVERLYSIENLSGELTARESSAWRNLIRVLTHEIMNTLTPVSSLAETCQDLLANTDVDTDVKSAMETIARRSEGLMDFVSRYRELLQVPQPKLVPVTVRQVFDNVMALYHAELSGIQVSVEVVPSSLEIQADPALVDQLLVNLVKNAIESLEQQTEKRLCLTASMDFGRVLIKIIDNGPGIPDEILDQVFVPFFTTKRSGSGIGLSLSRQIMTAHGGEIAVESNKTGTTITLMF